MLSIRLTRVGKKKQPTYRLVVQEKSRDPWGKSIEIVGSYNPHTKPKTLVLKDERIKHWLGNGAQPSTTVYNMLVDAKLVPGPKRNASSGKKKESKK